MKLSTKGRYGLTIMIDLAINYGNGPLSLKSIAEKHQLSDHYLEQLVSPIRNAGLVRSVRGAYGGYILTKSPEEINAADIIRILEGPIGPVECIAETNPVKCDKYDNCVKKNLWIKMRDSIIEILEGTSLADLARDSDGNDDCSVLI